LSRQRQWGVPMPFFVHKETGALHPRTPELLEQVAQRVEKEGIEAWQSVDAAAMLGADAATYEKIRDTLDVWFDSGATHYTVLRGSHKAQSAFPADLYLEGSDQHRGWFHSSLLTASMMDGRAPYKALLTHGFVVDGEGRKMSKSKGNVIVPQKVMDELGADILRLWVASTDYSGELSISKEILKRVVESYRRIRNTLRFLLANIADFDAGRHALPAEQWLEIDRYALELVRGLQDKVQAGYDRYEFHTVIQELTAFCSEDLGAFYLDILKDRLYTSGAGSRPRRAAQNALWHITHALLKMMSPVLSFTAEEAWQVIKGGTEGSIFEEEWHVLPGPALESGVCDEWGNLRQMRELANKRIEELRAQGVVGSSLQAELEIKASGAMRESLARLGDDLRFVFITSSVKVLEQQGPVFIQVDPSAHKKCERCWHYRADVGHDAQHPDLCGRCTANLYGAGEPRSYA
jgi:isoleucyl-tRNA synthetase